MSSALDRRSPPLAGFLTAVSIRIDPRSSPPPGGPMEVWRADLGAPAEELLELLSPEERARAARIVREEDRERWMRARAVLRALLGSHLESDPRGLCFQTGAHGKPALPGSELSFNISHSGGIAVYALARGVSAVGVDVELLQRRPRDEPALAERAFSPAIARRLRALDPAARHTEFLREWVRHEAALKCLGVGLSATSAAAERRADLWIAELHLDPHAVGALALTP
ncbi:MAG: 4'-phosphopantetheinyl transferase family protein [Solirubrobacterales bacterium]